MSAFPYRGLPARCPIARDREPWEGGPLSINPPPEPQTPPPPPLLPVPLPVPVPVPVPLAVVLLVLGAFEGLPPGAPSALRLARRRLYLLSTEERFSFPFGKATSPAAVPVRPLRDPTAPSTSRILSRNIWEDGFLGAPGANFWIGQLAVGAPIEENAAAVAGEQKREIEALASCPTLSPKQKQSTGIGRGRKNPGSRMPCNSREQHRPISFNPSGTGCNSPNTQITWGPFLPLSMAAWGTRTMSPPSRRAAMHQDSTQQQGIYAP